MRTYTVTQRGGYQVFSTPYKEEAETVLAEMDERCKGAFYICVQGKDE